MKHTLIILSILLLSSPLFSQSVKPPAVIVPTASLGEISKTRLKILEKTLESKIDDFFAIVPKELFEEAQEQAFEELDFEECTEEQCIRKIQELLQVENAFQMLLISEEGDTQVSVTWNDQDQKRVEEDYCEGCKTKGLRKMVGELIVTMLGNLEKKEIVKNIEEVEEEEFNVKESFGGSQILTFGAREKAMNLSPPGIRILFSEDGLKWVNKDFGTDENLNSIISSGNIKLMVDDDGNIIYSDEKSSWVSSKHNESELFSAIVVDNDFVVVGNDGAILKGNLGKFKKLNSNVKTKLKSITYGKNIYVVVGYDETILVSKNAVDWERITSDSSFQKKLNSVAYGNEKFVIVGDLGSIYWSEDGIDWKSKGDITATKLNKVKFVNDVFMALGNAGEILISQNGVDWEKRILKEYLDNHYGVAFGNNMYVICGSQGNIFVSQNAIKWRKINLGKKDLLDINFDGKNFVTVGEDGTQFISSDANEWIDLSFHNLNSISANKDVVILGGDKGMIYTSKGGNKWFSQKINSEKNINKILAKKDGYLAVGSEGLIAFSRNTNNWEVIEPITEENLNAASFGQNKYIVVGEDEELLMSIDGKKWEKKYVSNESSSNDLLDVDFLDNNFITLGESYLTFMSPNGESWSKIKIVDDRETSWFKDTSDIFYGVAFGKGQIVLVGESGITVNSKNWNLTQSRIEEDLKDVVFFKDKYIAVGNSGTILSSKDGIAWSFNQSGTDIDLKGIAVK